MFIQNWERDEARKKRQREATTNFTLERLRDRTVTLPPAEYEPGVYEEDIHPPGEHWVVILMPSGKVGTVKFPEELWDENVLPNLWKRFDAKTKRRLRAI